MRDEKMDAQEKAKKARLQDYMHRIGQARTDRNHYASRINEIFRYAQPDRLRVGFTTTTAMPADTGDDVFDEILQDVVEDFASDMVDTFTPKYRPWTSFKPKNSLTEGQKREIESALINYGDAIFSAIRKSNFYSQLFDVWVDISASCGALCIPFPEAGRNTVVHYVPLAELLFDEGPEGIDGRWWEQHVYIRYLKATFPAVDWSPILQKYPGEQQRNKKISVIQGAVRDWDRIDEEVWKWHIIADNKLVYETEYVGEGSCPLIPTRWRRSKPSAWGLGPASRGLAATRTLDRLGDELLKYVEKLVDTPHSYEEDMVQNYENGVDSGSYVPRMPGSAPPQPLFRPGGEAQIGYFQQEDLRQRVRRAMYQDKPIQRGDTPPTLGQWLDEKTTNNRRMENPRDRIVTEGVVPWIKRFAWIEAKSGRLPEVKIDGDLVEIEIQSPLSKASDLEDVSVASQVLQIGSGFLGEEFALSINGAETIRNIKAKLNDKLVVVLSEEQVAQRVAAAQGAVAPE